MKANIFEIGAAGPVSEYLIKNPKNWVNVSEERLLTGEPLVIPLDFKERYTDLEVFLIEPLPEIVDAFLGHFGNKFKNHLHIIQCAVGGTNSLRFIRLVDLAQLKGTCGRMAHFPEYLFTDNQGPGFYIPTFTLDTLFQSLNAYPTVLLVDIEGAEIETFEAYSFDPPPEIIIVDHHGKNYQKLENIFTKNNYRIVHKEWEKDNEDMVAYWNGVTV